jgi:hypothetical protein
MDAAVWVALGAVVVSVATLAWQAIDKSHERKREAARREDDHRREEGERAEARRDALADARRQARREFAVGFVAWVGLMRDALREPFSRSASEVPPERSLRLWGHAPKELWMLTEEPGSHDLVQAGERFFSKWEGSDLTFGARNFKMVRDAERLVAAVARWVETGDLPESFDEDPFDPPLQRT